MEKNKVFTVELPQFPHNDILLVTHFRTPMYQVESLPIDFTTGVNEQSKHPDTDDSWGLPRMFTKLDKDTEEYKELQWFYYEDEPAFIGKCMVPISIPDNYEMKIVPLYVVRCFNNGTTYFVSPHYKALLPFRETLR